MGNYGGANEPLRLHAGDLVPGRSSRCAGERGVGAVVKRKPRKQPRYPLRIPVIGNAAVIDKATLAKLVRACAQQAKKRRT